MLCDFPQSCPPLLFHALFALLILFLSKLLHFLYCWLTTLLSVPAHLFLFILLSLSLVAILWTHLIRSSPSVFPIWMVPACCFWIYLHVTAASKWIYKIGLMWDYCKWLVDGWDGFEGPKGLYLCCIIWWLYDSLLLSYWNQPSPNSGPNLPDNLYSFPKLPWNLQVRDTVAEIHGHFNNAAAL